MRELASERGDCGTLDVLDQSGKKREAQLYMKRLELSAGRVQGWCLTGASSCLRRRARVRRLATARDSVEPPSVSKNCIVVNLYSASSAQPLRCCSSTVVAVMPLWECFPSEMQCLAQEERHPPPIVVVPVHADAEVDRMLIFCSPHALCHEPSTPAGGAELFTFRAPHTCTPAPAPAWLTSASRSARLPVRIVNGADAAPKKRGRRRRNVRQ
jgi:hypothetical protein